ncbi:hypothetical protein ACFSTD_14550 [Novosphingobium colocasiae]
MAAHAPDAGRSWRWPATRAWLALRAPLRLPLIRQRGDHLVVVGSGMLARLIVRAELAAGGSVVLWADPADPAWARAAAGAGAAVVPLDDAEHTVTRLGLDRARAVLLLSDDDDRDIDLAGLVLAQAARSRPAGDPLAVIAGASGEPARERLRALAADVPRAIASARAIALDDLAARQVFIDHPLDRFRHHGRKERVVFLLGGSAALLRYARRMAAGGPLPRRCAPAPDLRRSTRRPSRCAAGSLGRTPARRSRRLCPTRRTPRRSRAGGDRLRQGERCHGIGPCRDGALPRRRSPCTAGTGARGGSGGRGPVAGQRDVAPLRHPRTVRPSRHAASGTPRCARPLYPRILSRRPADRRRTHRIARLAGRMGRPARKFFATITGWSPIATNSSCAIWARG